MPQDADTQQPIATRCAFVAECRRFLGVKWQHQGRTEKGIDCVGLLIVPALKLGLIEASDNMANYHRTPQDGRLDRLLHHHCRRLPKWQDAREADILAIKYANQPQHVAVVTRSTRWGLYVIHAFGNAEIGGSVVEHRLDDLWLKSHRARIHAGFQIKGIRD